MKTITLLLLLFLVTHPVAGQVHDYPPVTMANGERLLFKVEQQDDATSRSIYLTAGDAAPVRVWTRRRTDGRHWSDDLQRLHAADRQGDHLAIYMDQSQTYFRRVFLRINLATGEAKGTEFNVDGPLRSFPGGNQFKVTGPGTLTVGHESHTQEIEWHANGEVSVDGVVIKVFPPRDNGTGFPLSVSGMPPPASPEVPLPAASTQPVPAAPIPPLIRSHSRAQQTNRDDASGWLVATGVLALLGGALLCWRMKSRA